jgi:hypothetical protein
VGYRDDEEALRQRVENLQRDVDEARADRAENEALKRRVAELERRRSTSAPADRRTSPR